MESNSMYITAVYVRNQWGGTSARLPCLEQISTMVECADSRNISHEQLAQWFREPVQASASRVPEHSRLAQLFPQDTANPY